MIIDFKSLKYADTITKCPPNISPPNISLPQEAPQNVHKNVCKLWTYIRDFTAMVLLFCFEKDANYEQLLFNVFFVQKQV